MVSLWRSVEVLCLQIIILNGVTHDVCRYISCVVSMLVLDCVSVLFCGGDETAVWGVRLLEII